LTAVAIIPARAGSKRIPGKNTKLLGGKPALAYPVEACLRSGLFFRVVVSTDSAEVAALARELGAEAPFLRPAELSDDHTPTAPVVSHCLDQLAPCEFFCCVYATAVMVRPEDLRTGYELLRQGADGALAVTAYDFPIYRALREEAGGWLAMVWPEHELTRSNDLPEVCHDAGQFYWRRTQDFRQDPRMYAARSRGVRLPRWRAQDLDTPEDWELVERLLR